MISRLCQNSERLRISFEIFQISGHLRSQPFPERFLLISDIVEMLFEPVADGRFSKMAERRIPQIVKKPAQSRTEEIPSAASALISAGLYWVLFLESMIPSWRATVETSIEWVSLVRIKSLLSSGKTCVLSCSLRNAELETILL